MLVHVAACDVYPRARAAILKHDSGSKELRRSVRAVRKKQDLARQAQRELRKLKKENRDLLDRIDAASRNCKETRRNFKKSVLGNFVLTTPTQPGTLAPLKILRS